MNCTLPHLESFKYGGTLVRDLARFNQFSFLFLEHRPRNQHVHINFPKRVMFMRANLMICSCGVKKKQSYVTEVKGHFASNHGVHGCSEVKLSI